MTNGSAVVAAFRSSQDSECRLKFIAVADVMLCIHHMIHVSGVVEIWKRERVVAIIIIVWWLLM